MNTDIGNEYRNTVDVYLSTVEILMSMNSNLYYKTKNDEYINFRVPAFKTVLGQRGRGENYRFYLKQFRTLSWIVCQPEKFSNIQRIDGKLIRVITVDSGRYTILKETMEQGRYFTFLERFMRLVEQILFISDQAGKNLYFFSKEGQVLNVKSTDCRLLLKKICQSMEEYKESLELFRRFEWIISQPGNYTNVQWIGGQPKRVISIDYEKYKLMKAFDAE